MRNALFAAVAAATVLPAAAQVASAADVLKPAHYATYTLSCHVLHNGGQTYFWVENRVVSRIPKGHTITITYNMFRTPFRSPQTTTVTAHADVPRYGRTTFAGVSGARRCGATVRMMPITAVM